LIQAAVSALESDEAEEVTFVLGDSHVPTDR
jgi:hypothetical protein